jgi:hypothetical protein
MIGVTNTVAIFEFCWSDFVNVDQKTTARFLFNGDVSCGCSVGSFAPKPFAVVSDVTHHRWPARLGGQYAAHAVGIPSTSPRFDASGVQGGHYDRPGRPRAPHRVHLSHLPCRRAVGLPTLTAGTRRRIRMCNGLELATSRVFPY